MTATTTAGRTTAATGRGAGRAAGSWAGTGQLLRLALRRDRVRTPIWVLALTLTSAVTVPALEAVFTDAAGQQARTELVNNPAGVMMSGPIFGDGLDSLGAMVANEISLTLLVATAIMSILLVVRHTRAEEEQGRTDLVRAQAVGRFAPAAAGLLAAAVADLAVAVGVVAGLQGYGLPLVDCVAFGVAVGLTGLVFGAVAAVTAQLTTSSRAASGMALAALGVAFLVRGIGDVIDITGSPLSWFSPIAWAQQTRLFVDLRWWPLALSLAAVVALAALAASLGRRRDLGGALLGGGAGRAAAPGWLASPAGLAWRLQRGAFWGWAIGVTVAAVAFGSLASYLEDALADVPALQDWMALDLGAITETFGATMLLYLVLAIGGYAVSAVLRLRAEESAGTGALTIVGGPGRLRWLAGWSLVVTAQLLALLVLAGTGVGAGMALSTGDGGHLATMTTAALAYLPGVLVMAALAAALFGAWPRGATLAWVAVAYALVVGYFGELLELPQWARNVSPLAATPFVPVEEVSAVPLLVLSTLAVVLAAVAFAVFRRRDVQG